MLTNTTLRFASRTVLPPVTGRDAEEPQSLMVTTALTQEALTPTQLTAPTTPLAMELTSVSVKLTDNQRYGQILLA